MSSVRSSTAPLLSSVTHSARLAGDASKDSRARLRSSPRSRARGSTVRRSSRCAWCAAPRVTSGRRGGARGVQVVRCPAQGARPDGRRVRCWRRAASIECGRCGRCGHLAAFRAPRLCEPCHRRWVAGGKPDLSEFASTRLRGDREPTREVDLSALGERVRLEILYAFQELWLDGGYAWVSTRHLQGAIDLVARTGVTSLLDELWMSSRDSLWSVLPAAARPGRTAAGRSRARAFDGRVANGDPASRRRAPAD